MLSFRKYYSEKAVNSDSENGNFAIFSKAY
ncbi:MAG: hypothetical protein Ct9H90mP10_06810 [Actinomycetota bacterium]|nr:MAG: hypothetical protein Ct9H90mP10_06810 [Actinomycetota bacterium]